MKQYFSSRLFFAGKSSWLIFIGLIGLLVSPTSVADLQSQREMFVRAEKALDANNLKSYRALKKQLTNYPLSPYLEYRELKKFLSSQKPENIEKFLLKHADTPLSDRLRRDWLKNLAKRKQWQTFVKFYQPNLGSKVDCLQLDALFHTGQQQTAYAKTTDMWLHERSRPKSCDPAFARWQKAGLQTTALTWQRIQLAINAGEIRLARYLAKSLPQKDRSQVQQWLTIRKHPEKTQLKNIDSQHPFRQEALADGIIRLSRKDLPEAISRWEKLKNHIVYAPELISEVERVIALQFLDEERFGKFDYLVFAEPCDADSKLQEIRIRAALLHKRWHDVLTWLDRLPPAERNKDRWRYWEARSLRETNQKERAKTIFAEVAKERSFYGFLAADQINSRYAMNHNTANIDPDIDQDLRQLPAVLRTAELLALDRRLDARREWYQLTRGLDEEDLIGLARIAHEWNWHDRAIFTLAQAKYWDDLAMRFPLEYRQLVEQRALDNDLEPAWIFAMMRQESAFMHDARSSVGAVGLMQLMPKTAKAVAKKLKKPRPGYQQLIKPELNIQLGSAYLKEVYEELGEHPVLAIAAYNAGPHRVRNWLPESGQMPADIWIELIPFKETRRYVKSVLAYMVIYSNKLENKDFRLQDRMPVVLKSIEDIQLAAEQRKNSTTSRAKADT